ncbi:BCLAF1 and THRAP3 family member 3 isoform X2 [Antennarius striatus]|uniref:BCLAF1 and THRAP3 family member 3 isoform X2 n=1 Tax=Antennarius striatus TaxID=241820 RepID=UPI0035B1A9E1
MEVENMSRRSRSPHSSAQSSPSDRQLSLDLVNVGRQRLDFLPMLEHSGMRHKSPGHTGTFAQEIITLVHRVKEQYFSGGGITMNERFSSLPTPVFSEAEVTELTLDQRFSSTRGFSVEADALLDEDEPLFSRPGSLQANDGDFKMGEEQRVSRWSSVSDGMQPVRGPGDLRHDLERKRQQRLEGVKVTISGTSQRPLAPHSVSAPEGLSDQLGLMGAHGSSSWGRQGSMGTQKGTGFQRRNSRFSNQLGPMRRKNPHNNPAGSHW